MSVLLLAAAAAIATAAPASAQSADSPQQAFYSANMAYANADYPAAEALFRNALSTAESAELHYNLANTLAKQERWAEASVHYLRSHLLDPSLSDARGNLMLAKERLGLDESFPALPEPAALLSAKVWLIIAASAFWLGLFLLLHRRLIPWRLPAARTAASVCFVLFAIAAISCLQHNRFLQLAVVLESGSTLRVAPTPHSPGHADLPAGQVIRILQPYQDFIHVRLSNGREGFLTKEELAPLALF